MPRTLAVRALGLAVTASLGLSPVAHAQAPGQAPPPDDTTAAPPPAPISPEADMTGREAPAPSTPLLNKPLRPGKKAEAKPQPTLVAPANNVTATGAGMGGRMIAADDPEARRAEAELEGTALEKEGRAGIPKRLPPLQRAAWWCMFGTFALGSTGGVFAGLAEVQEDEAQRVVITLDTDTGGQQLYTGDARTEYERALSTGKRDSAIGRGFLAAGGVTLVAGVVLFIVHATRARKQGRLSAAAGGLAVHF